MEDTVLRVAILSYYMLFQLTGVKKKKKRLKREQDTFYILELKMKYINKYQTSVDLIVFNCSYLSTVFFQIFLTQLKIHCLRFQ